MGQGKLQVILTLLALLWKSFPEIVALVLRKVVKHTCIFQCFFVLNSLLQPLPLGDSATDEVWVCYSICSQKFYTINKLSIFPGLLLWVICCRLAGVHIANNILVPVTVTVLVNASEMLMNNSLGVCPFESQISSQKREILMRNTPLTFATNLSYNYNYYNNILTRECI